MIVFLGIGSNRGEREKHIENALSMLDTTIGTRLSCSDFFYSAPAGFSSPHQFANIVVAYMTSMHSWELLEHCQRIEHVIDAQPHSYIDENGKKQYLDRRIDIDILLFTEEMPHSESEALNRSIHLNSKTLVIPHPRMQERDFVILPLEQILTLP